MVPIVVEGDLLEQDVDVIVNAWNRDFIPWWLLVPQGVSRAIRRRAGSMPFREVRRVGLLPLGGAIATSAGRLPYKAIIHVAGIGLSWAASVRSIQGSVVSAMAIVEQRGFGSIAFPIIGAGTGGFGEDGALQLMSDAFRSVASTATVRIVRYRPA
jgi:O-acetyl-ADP-ribose deacetylase